MTKRCLDEGLLQAYIDGELSQDETARAAAHIAACDACAAALASVEDENSFFATAFAPDDSINVPTELLRSRIDAAVAQIEDARGLKQSRSNGWNFNGFLATLSSLFTFTPQRAAAFASVLVLIVAGVIYFAVIKRQGTTPAPQPSHELASKDIGNTNPKATTTPTPKIDEPVNAPSPTSTTQGKPSFVNVKHTPRSRVNRPDETPTPTPAPKEQMLPGEKSYQTAIASLEKTIKMGGDASLKPSLRVEYERNLAILDTAIAQTRQVAAQNPKDKDAVGFLMSAYQSKVELLTKVADQAQVAALGR